MTDCAARLLAPAIALPGTWKLAGGHAVTLRPGSDGILRISQGRVWATVEGPHGHTPDDSGDHVLEAGGALPVRAGEALVIEAWNSGGASWFTWDPACAPAAVRPRTPAAGLLQPLADLRVALALAGRALHQMASTLAQLGWDALRGGRAPARHHRLAG